MVPAVKLYWITRSAIGAMSTATILSVYMAQNFEESESHRGPLTLIEY
jgi:hypothetical protein